MSASEWIVTGSGNRIHKSCVIKGSTHILINGYTTINENSTISIENREGNKSPSTVIIGKFCYLAPRVYIEPSKLKAAEQSDYSIKIGNYTIIETDAKVRALSVGSRCLIGKNVVLGEKSIIYDCCVIEDDVNIPSGYIIPPFSLVKRVQAPDSKSVNFSLQRLPESFDHSMEYCAKQTNVLGYIAYSIIT